MKKVFWTIVVVLLLIVAFVFYMKWFNEPLAKSSANFIFKSEVQENTCAILTGKTLDENEVLSKLDTLEKHINTIENLIEVQNAKLTPDQFDTETTNVEDEPTEEELFEEFKAWRENNK